MIDTALLVAISIATFAIPLLFIALVVVAALRRSRGARVGERLILSLTFVGALAIGVLALAATFAILTLVPILVAGGALVASLWRTGRHRGVGLALVGLGLPEIIGAALGAPLPFAVRTPGTPDTAALGTILTAAAVIAVGAGLLLAARGEVTSSSSPTPGTSERAPATGSPAGRRIGDVGRAILEPTMVGPFSLPLLASLVAVVVSWLLVPPIVAAVTGGGRWSFAPAVAAVLVGAVLGTEAYIRAFPRRARRAFEAFSWYGEWELAAARAFVGPIPRTRSAAEAWLATQPPVEGDAGIRAEILVLAGRFDEARSVAASMPASTPLERWQRAATTDFVDWSAGGEGDLSSVRATIAGLAEGSDDRWRAEVSYALATVRHTLAEPDVDRDAILDPLLEVRERLGRRADGQLGRALRRRLFLVYALSGAVIAGLTILADSLPAVVP